METDEIYERSKLNANTYRLVSYTLVSLMIVCAAVTFVSLASRFNPDYQPYYLLVLCFIVALDRLYTYRVFNQWTVFSREWSLLFASHAVVIVAVTKTAVGLSHGWANFTAEIPTWGTNFPITFLDAETTFSLFLILGVWLVCGRFAEFLEEIGPDQIQSMRLDLVANDRKGNIPARQRLIHLYFWVGTILAILTILSRVDMRLGLTNGHYDPTLAIPALAVGGASTLLYFMLGLVLLSQTQFISLHIRWNIQRIPISGKLARQWTLYSLLFLGLIAATVSLLPTSYGIRPLEMLAYGLNMVVFVVLYFGQLMFVAGMAILSRLFGQDPPGPDSTSVMPPDMPASPTDAAGVGGSPAWLEIIKGLIFWAIFTVVIFWAVRQYLRQNRELLEKLRRLAGWGWLAQLLNWLRGLWGQVKSSIETIAELTRRSAPLSSSEHVSGNGFINLRRLDPRQKVYFFYLAFIRRAGEKQLPRSSHQTPDEYAATLQRNLPEAAEDIQALTQAFVSARYSRQPVETAQAQTAETIWGRLRKALQRKQTHS